MRFSSDVRVSPSPNLISKSLHPASVEDQGNERRSDVWSRGLTGDFWAASSDTIKTTEQLGRGTAKFQ